MSTVPLLYAPAAAEGRLGGDLHAVCESPYGLRLLIGDVRGRGQQAAGGADALLAAFRAVAPTVSTLRGLVHVLEQAMLQYVGSRSDPLAAEDFATIVAAEFSPDGDVLRLVNRGHPAPLLLRPSGVRALGLGRYSLPLGLRELAPHRDPTLALPFPADATLLLITDGTTEARDAEGAFYDPVVRLAGHGTALPEELVRLLRSEVGDHTQGHRPGGSDDMAVLAVRPHRRAGARGAAPLTRAGPGTAGDLPTGPAGPTAEVIPAPATDPVGTA